MSKKKNIIVSIINIIIVACHVIFLFEEQIKIGKRYSEVLLKI